MGSPRSWLEELSALTKCERHVEVEICGSGETESGLPFVSIGSGRTFYGLPDNPSYKQLYQRLTPAEREKSSLPTFSIISDIQNRYLKRKQHRRYAYRPGDVVVELGAYLGFYSLYVADSVGPSGRVMAVEFMPDVYPVLQRNLREGSPGNTVAIHKGVWTERGKATVYVGGGQRNGFRCDVISKGVQPVATIEVETDTIDGILEDARVDHVDLLILQINGIELKVLEAIERSWSKIDHLAVAANYDDGDVRAPEPIADLLDERGYATEIFGRWVYAKRWPGGASRRKRMDDGGVFIGGCGRSGTTLLRVMLDSHRSFACGPESNLILDPVNLDVPYLAFKFDRTEDEVLRLAGESGMFPDFVERFLGNYAKETGKPRWAEKTPQNVHHIEYIFDNFPNAKFIHVIRDGRDAVCSLRTHPRYRLSGERWVENEVRKPFRECVERWIRDVSAGIRWRGHPRYTEVRYEDLICDTERTLRRLLEFLGEPWDPAVLQYYEQKGSSRDAKRFPQNKRAVEPISEASIGRWKKDMDQAEESLFDELAGDLMSLLGYS